MKQIKEWTAKRAGDSITVEGKDPDGKSVKLTGVATIDAAQGTVRAIDKDGKATQLLLD